MISRGLGCSANPRQQHAFCAPVFGKNGGFPEQLVGPFEVVRIAWYTAGVQSLCGAVWES